MSRTAVPPQQLTGPYGTPIPALPFTAGDPGNGMQFVLVKGDILIIWNSDVGTHHFTLTSVADVYGRSQDVTAQALLAGAFAVFGPIDFPGWQQPSDGTLHFTCDDATIKFAVLRAN
jgi:hypothetical protein